MSGGQATGIPTSTTFEFFDSGAYELPGYTVERTLGLSWG